MGLVELAVEDHIAIYYDEGEEWLHMDSRGYQTVGSVMEGCERMLALMVERRVRSVRRG